MAVVRRLFLPPAQWVSSEVTCDGDVARRVASVLRMRGGELLRVFDGAGREREARVETVSPRSVRLTLLDEVAPLPEPRVHVILACAFPRGGRGDWIVEKATELGVAQIVPIEAGRAVLAPGDNRYERWRRIAVEAAEQCGRAVVPRIGGDVPASALPLVADPRATSSVREALDGREPGAVAVYVGPEGGWSADEQAAHVAAGMIEVSLGPRILRVETAAIVAVAQLIEATGGASPPASGDVPAGSKA